MQLAQEVIALQQERDRMSRVIAAFRETVSDARRAWDARGKGGQQVPFHGDFASVPPSAMGRLVWWARELEKASNHE